MLNQKMLNEAKPVVDSIRRILCPIDLTRDSNQPLAYAVAIARAFQAQLFLCHCVDSSLPDGGKRVKGRFVELMEPLISRSDASPIDWEGIIIEGKPDRAIVEAAYSRQIDLIVMHSRRRPFTAALLGSTAETISRLSPCPLLVMHHHERVWADARAGKIEPKRLMVAFDNSDNAKLALSYALMLASKNPLELHILKVDQIDKANLWSSKSAKTMQAKLDKLAECIPVDAKAYCNIKPIIAEGNPADEILSYCEENRIDLICMGAHNKTNLDSHFDATLESVMRVATCPVLIAKPIDWQSEDKNARKGLRVLVASDGSSFSEAAVRVAAARVWPKESELRVITVMEPLSTIGPPETHYKLPSQVLTALEEVAASAASKLLSEGIAVSHVVREGLAADQIIKEANEWGADTIILGSHGLHGMRRFLIGSVAERVAAFAPCSVEIVRAPRK